MSDSDDPVRALLVVRADAATKAGGDIVHAEHAAAALRGLGVHADLVASDEPDPRGYDVAHLFGIFDPPRAARQIASIRSAGVPLVISPIWLDLRALFAIAPHLGKALARGGSRAVERRLARLRRNEAALPWHGGVARNADRRLATQRALLRDADVLLPASETEAYLYGERLRVSELPFVVAPLGVATDALAQPRAQPRRGVVCAARIEPKKNQAALLYALRDVDVDVTILGAAHDPEYLELCRRWATPRTRFVDHVARAQTLEMMAAAAVHAHPSWLESPGLSSLEAAAAGAHVVAGDRGCEREYFGSDVDYADPSDPASIRAAVVRALARPPRAPGDALELRLRGFTWERHARATRDAYRRALAARST